MDILSGASAFVAVRAGSDSSPNNTQQAEGTFRKAIQALEWTRWRPPLALDRRLAGSFDFCATIPRGGVDCRKSF
jgi:hypothetical protein